MRGPGDAVPHFSVTDIRGGAVSYRDIWQHRALVLIVFPREPAAAPASYVAELTEQNARFATLETTCVLTRDAVADLPAPGAVVADRWGEIVWVTPTLPEVGELLEWAEHLRHRCPECEGESR